MTLPLRTCTLLLCLPKSSNSYGTWTAEEGKYISKQNLQRLPHASGHYGEYKLRANFLLVCKIIGIPTGGIPRRRKSICLHVADKKFICILASCPLGCSASGGRKGTVLPHKRSSAGTVLLTEALGALPCAAHAAPPHSHHVTLRPSTPPCGDPVPATWEGHSHAAAAAMTSYPQQRHIDPVRTLQHLPYTNVT